jgi:hypothetical protein
MHNFPLSILQQQQHISISFSKLEWLHLRELFIEQGDLLLALGLIAMEATEDIYGLPLLYILEPSIHELLAVGVYFFDGCIDPSYAVVQLETFWAFGDYKASTGI